METDPIRRRENDFEAASGWDVTPAPTGIAAIFLGRDGLRAGWAAALFSVLTALLYLALQIFNALIGLVRMQGFSPRSALVEKLMEVAAVVAATVMMASIEVLRPAQLYLDARSAARRFAEGAAAGFVTLSALVGLLMAGGWMQLSSPSLSWPALLKYAIVWGLVFAATGIAEEGAFRCYLLRTLERGINLWAAAATVAVLCGLAALRSNGHGGWGVYLAALLGLLPCCLLSWRKCAQAPFWQAAWISSVAFGFWHMGNSNESWVGILAAALVGAVFCASIRRTGSLWWAIGCHAAWDWSETFFWGAADSGLPARGHLFAVNPAGNPLWSGGNVGPEGSLLAPLVILALLGALLALYRRRPLPADSGYPDDVHECTQR